MTSSALRILNSGWMVITVLLTFNGYVMKAEGIVGFREGCNEEGEIVPVNYIKADNIRCFSCICKNGFVECSQKRCKSQEGCYMLEEEQKDECCRTCKGCLHNGIERESDTEWRDPYNPCKVYYCKAGVVTESEEICYDAPCRNVIPAKPGECCPRCKSCIFNSQLVPEGREVTIPEDPCLKCFCYNETLTCSKRACPVLQCPDRNRVNIPGECCPICRGNRSLKKVVGNCLLVNKLLHPSHPPFALDFCTRCSCMNGTNICQRETCSVLTCPVDGQVTTPGQCCPRCPPPEESRAACVINGKTYEDGESWQLDSCISCTCHQGSPRCIRQMCPNANIPCSANQKLVHEPGECCPKCIESDGVCTVFGDPHYRTFDGKFFSYQGSCKYILASDCTGRSFTIRVTNDARSTKTSSWTKTVSIMLGVLKVNLGQKMRTKVNGKKVDLPFEIDDKVKITKTDDSVLVETSLGVKVLWNGNSVLEVSVPTVYKNRLCGLCGNFNSVPKDDLTTRLGVANNDTEKFGLSWRVGGRKACGRDYDGVKKCGANGKDKKKREFLQKCALIKAKVFNSCNKKVNYQLYYRSCMEDMCECPSNKCYCESLTAYAHECERLGVKLTNWRNVTNCPSSWTKHRNKSESSNISRLEWENELPIKRRKQEKSPKPKLIPNTIDRPQSHPRPPPPLIH